MSQSRDTNQEVLDALIEILTLLNSLSEIPTFLPDNPCAKTSAKTPISSPQDPQL